MAARSGERGQATLLGAGLVLVALLVAGLAFDVWRIVDGRRRLAIEADAVVAAGANGIDVDRYRSDGVLALEPGLATSLATERLAVADPDLVLVDLVVTDEALEVTLASTLELVLLDLGRSAEVVTVRVTASAGPRRGA